MDSDVGVNDTVKKSRVGFRYGFATLLVLVAGVCGVFATIQHGHSTRYRKTREYEKLLEEKILALHDVHGMRVTVSAELDDTLKVKWVRASVLVPQKYYVDLWQCRHRTAQDAETSRPTATNLQKIEYEVKAKIEDTVCNLLPPLSADVDPYPCVQVVTYDDLRMADRTAAIPAEKSPR